MAAFSFWGKISTAIKLGLAKLDGDAQSRVFNGLAFQLGNMLFDKSLRRLLLFRGPMPDEHIEKLKGFGIPRPLIAPRPLYLVFRVINPHHRHDHPRLIFLKIIFRPGHDLFGGGSRDPFIYDSEFDFILAGIKNSLELARISIVSA